MKASRDGVRAMTAIGVSLAGATALLTLTLSQATASQTRLFQESFGSANQPSFSRAEGLAVDQGTGDLLVIDNTSTTDTITRWNADGTPSEFSALGSNAIDGEGGADLTPENGLNFGGETEVQVAIDESGGPTDGDIYVAQGAASKVIDIFSSSGQYLGQLNKFKEGIEEKDFGRVCGVAVDSAGNVYVGDQGLGKIYKFTPKAPAHNPLNNSDYLTSFETVPQPCTLAAGAGPTMGSLFVNRNSAGSRFLFKLDAASGSLYYQVSPSSGHFTVVVDPVSGHVIAAVGSDVREYDASGATSASPVTQFRAASSSVVEGVAVNGIAEKVYASRQGNLKVEVYGSLVPIPDAATELATNIVETSATLHGTVDPDGAELTECRFEYGTTTAYGLSAPCAESPAEIGSETDPVPVHADIASLSAGTVYHFRLRAKNANGEGVQGKDETFKTLGPPAISGDLTSGVAVTEATLRAMVNPEGLSTTYRFEWGSTTLYGNSTPETPIGSDRSDHTVTTTLTGLLPGATYHWRIVATNASSVTEGEDRAFTTHQNPAPDTTCSNQARRIGAAAALPDCRAYEMVSPVDKNGADIDAYSYEGFDAGIDFGGMDQSTPEGGKLAYTAPAAFGDPEGSARLSEYIATRGAGGWESESLNPPMRGGVAGEPALSDSQFKAFSEDLRYGWLKGETGLPLTSPGPVPGFANLYRRDNLNDQLTWLESSSPKPEPCLGDCFFFALFPEIQGFTPNGDCAAFRVNDALKPEAPRGIAPEPNSSTVHQLYQWCEGAGVQLASVLPSGAPFEGDATAGTELLGEPGGAATNARGRVDMVENALSEDGTRLYWTASSQEPTPALYLRVNADRPLELGKGTGDLSLLGIGKGTVNAGSTTVTAFSTTTGSFTVGESISGFGIPAGTTIAAVGGGTLTLSAPATASAPNVLLRSGSKEVTNVTTTVGAFAVGQRIAGTGIATGTTITAVGPSSLTLSIGATQEKAATALTASKDCTGPEEPCTLRVSPPGENPRFWTASQDGSRAIFTVSGRIYEYVYDEAQEKGEAIEIAPKALGVAGASEDASRVYFVSREVCSGSSTNSAGASAQEGKANLYLYESGESCTAGEMAFVGTLAEGDISAGGNLGAPSPVASVPRDHIARATPDGAHLTFVSAAQLTDYDNRDATSSQLDREVYLYDGGSGTLLCPSCKPSGARPNGENLQTGPAPLWTAAWIPGYQHELYGRRPLSEDGSRLFFNSVDALSLRDVNGAQDVYQWEAPGTGGCAVASPSYSAQNGGCVDLISSGDSPRDSEFVDASANGEDVFIRTESSLLPQDPGSVDIYDARVGGGFDVPVAPVPCEGDACQSPPPPPANQTPASAAFQGPGDPQAQKPRHCRKGKVRRKGRCVAKKRHPKRAGGSSGRRAAR